MSVDLLTSKLAAVVCEVSRDCAGQLVQWRVHCDDVEGRRTWSPAPSADLGARYYGTVIAQAASSTSLPVLHWFTLDEAAATSAEGDQVSITIFHLCLSHVGAISCQARE